MKLVYLIEANHLHYKNNLLIYNDNSSFVCLMLPSNIPSSQALLYSINQNGFLTHYILSRIICCKKTTTDYRKKKYCKIENALVLAFLLLLMIKGHKIFVVSRKPFILSNHELSIYYRQFDLYKYDAKNLCKHL